MTRRDWSRARPRKPTESINGTMTGPLVAELVDRYAATPRRCSKADQRAEAEQAALAFRARHASPPEPDPEIPDGAIGVYDGRRLLGFTVETTDGWDALRESGHRINSFRKRQEAAAAVLADSAQL